MTEPSVPLPGARPDAASATSTRRKSPSSAAAVVAALAVGMIIGALALSAVGVLDGDDDPFAGRIDGDTYQAVILSNDKVYFGRLRSVSETFFALDDAFFLRETRGGTEGDPVRALLPINSELHAPENRMLIRKDEVVLVENLAKDSPVRNEIARQAEGGAPAVGRTTTTRPDSTSTSARTDGSGAPAVTTTTTEG